MDNNPFYDNEPLRDLRGSSSWDPLRGKSRLLYDCVWIVYVSRLRAHPAPTLDERPGGSKCAPRELASKLHLGIPICALRVRSQLIANHEGTRPQATLVLSYRRLPRGSYNLLPNLTTWLVPLWQSLRWRRWGASSRIVFWLILPVVICLSQRLSHACLSISIIQRNCEWLIKTVIVYLIIKFTWIPVVILELIHAATPDFLERWYLLDNKPIFFGLLWWIIITDRIARSMTAINHSSFCPISFRW